MNLDEWLAVRPVNPDVVEAHKARMLAEIADEQISQQPTVDIDALMTGISSGALTLLPGMGDLTSGGGL